MAKHIKAEILGRITKRWGNPSLGEACTSVRKIYEIECPKGNGSRNWNGYLLEALILKLLQTKISADCIFTNCRLALIEDTKYDILLCATSKDGKSQSPICLSIKTSLRERYKQAEIEGVIAKNVYKRCFTALLTMNSKELKSRKTDLHGIDMAVDCTNAVQLEELIKKILSLNPTPRSLIRTLGPLIVEPKIKTCKSHKANLQRKA